MLDNKYYELNKRFDARMKMLLRSGFNYRITDTTAVFSKTIHVVKNQIFSASFVMHADNDIYLDQIKNYLTKREGR